jgi:hypothetical protein
MTKTEFPTGTKNSGGREEDYGLYNKYTMDDDLLYSI